MSIRVELPLCPYPGSSNNADTDTDTDANSLSERTKAWLDSLLQLGEGEGQRSLWHWIVQFAGNDIIVAEQVYVATKAQPKLARLRDQEGRVAFEVAAPLAKAAIARVSIV